MRRSGRAGMVGCIGALAGLLVCLPGLVSAQTSLERVDELAREGRADRARTLLSSWWEEERPSASRQELQRGLWLRAILTVSPDQAALDFTRLVVEHPGGPFSDQALMRLGQAAAAAGEPVRAASRFEALVRDYPESPLRLEAREWLDRNRERVAAARRERRDQVSSDTVVGADAGAEPDTVDAVAAADTVAARDTPAGEERTDTVALGGEESPDTVALDDEEAEVAQVGGQGPDTAAVVADSLVADVTPERLDTLATDSAGAVGAPPTGKHDFPRIEEDVAGARDSSAASADAGDFTVQLGAFMTEDRAATLAATARAADLEPRLVRVSGSELIRVRIGRFDDPTEATRLYDRVRELGFEALVVADAGREEPLR